MIFQPIETDQSLPDCTIYTEDVQSAFLSDLAQAVGIILDSEEDIAEGIEELLIPDTPGDNRLGGTSRTTEGMYPSVYNNTK